MRPTPSSTPPIAWGHLRNRYLLLADALALPAAAVAAYVIRFEGFSWPGGHATGALLFLALSLPAKLLVMWALGLYTRLWRYASTLDLEVLAWAVVGSGVVGATIGIGLIPAIAPSLGRVPLSVVAIDALLGGVAVAAPRIYVRLRTQRRRRRPTTGRRALVVGAGASGSLIVRELAENPQLSLVPVALVDDDPSKRDRRLHGVPVVGTLADLGSVAQRLAVDEIIIAMPSAPGRVVRQVVQTAAEVGIPTRTVPGLYELLDGRKSVSGLRDVNIEDLLRREPVKTDMVRVAALARNRTVLVTGAGGSIGSELCRQLARLEPSRIVALGRGENSVFELLQELARIAPGVPVEPIIADVRDEGRMRRVYREFRPESVFHAAAHKHVPLMETNVAEAVLNNVLGTQVAAELALEHGVERFVLISSDKAVRPSSVMGATKRIAEGVVQDCAVRSGRVFASVRFGNVLGSRGSVIPVFLRQIQAGGPLTVTHPDMRRYFMTIPEAVQLVLQAGAMGQGGEVFVLDMGEPVRVLDLARDLIRLSGLVEGEDIEIRFSGIRPGEKLHEELFFGAENAAPTSHPKVLKARNATLAINVREAVAELVDLALHDASGDELRHAIARIVPEYTGGPAAAREPAAEPRRAPARANGQAAPEPSAVALAPLA